MLKHLKRIGELLDQRDALKEVRDALEKNCPDTFGNNPYWYELNQRLLAINVELVNLGFGCNRGKRK